MVAIVSGNSLGLSLTSSTLLGDKGALALGQGRSGERAYVNIATGNLVLRDLDDRLVGRGLDIGAVRTYNSQGLLDDDNGDNWTSGALQRVQLNGTVNTAGSTITRTDRDGASATYEWDSARSLYVSSAGNGAFDTVAYDSGSSQFVWTDGSTAVVERYEATGSGRILSAVDPAGNTLSYTYNGSGLLESIATANGEITYFDYTGTNLTQIRTAVAGGITLTSVHYAYDSSNRLASVTVDLTPADNSVVDNNTYVTTYTYDGSSKRLASITQGDGTSLTISYVQVGTEYKVATIANSLGQSYSYNYDTVNRRTTVLDPLGFATIYEYDANGQLTQITGPAVNGVSQVNSFSYNARGDLTQTIDGEGHVVVMEYDSNGNLVLQRDDAGNTIARTYDSNNQVLTETVYATPDPDGAGAGQPALPITTRYVYDASHPGQLRFVLSPEGRVVEHRYDGYGQRVASIAYGGVYDLSSLATNAAPAIGDLDTWVTVQNKAITTRTDFTYDARGQLLTQTAYSQVGATGSGVSDGSQSVTQFVYDRNGLLLQTISATEGVTQYAYDGLGRLISIQDALDQITATSYDDANKRTTVTSANGLVTTSTYDGAGRLVSVLQGTAQSGNLGQTQYVYDGNGRPYLRIDPTGVRTAMLYDAAGGLVAEIDSTYRLTEYVYDKNDQLTQKIVYSNGANPTSVDALFAAPSSMPADPLAAVRPTATAADLRSWRIYDDAGRLVRTVDAAGAVVDTVYDGASRVMAIVEYSQTIGIGALGAAPTLAATTPTEDAAADRVTRNFYDADGLLRGTLDAEGYLTELRYDGQGRQVRQIAYATPTATAERASGTLAQLVPASSDDDMSSRWLYDAQGRVAAEIDAEGYLTERVYDEAGNITQTVRYATRVNAALLAQIAPETGVSTLRPDLNPKDRSTSITYDLLNRISTQTNYEGTVTEYSYDSVGHLVQTISAAGTDDARTLNARYDVLGRLTGELTGEGSALLTGSQTQAEIDAIWAQYGLAHTYDAAGRRTSTTDANGHRTLFFYDTEGRLTHSVNALGEVTEQQFNTLGQLAASIRYGTRISTSGLAGGLVNTTLSNAIGAIANSAVDSRRTYSYNATGALVAGADALGNLTQLSYNAFGEEIARDLAIGDGRHLIQTQSLDRRGFVTGTVSDASGVNAITSAVYDAFGRATRTVDANGNVREQSYDRLGRVVQTVDPLNADRSTSYDAFDRVLTQTDALGHTTTFAYDDAQRSLSITSPEGIVVTTSHTRHGQTQEVIDGNGNSTIFTYDRNGNRIQVDTDLTTTEAVFDRANRLIQTIDANGNVVAFTYDAANRLLTRAVDPDGLNLVTTYQYDAKGQQIGVTDPNGILTQLIYDLKGQLILQAVDPSWLNLRTQYTYDALGNTLTVKNPRDVTTQYSYDNLGRRVQEIEDLGGLNLTRSYTYDRNGNVTSSTNAIGSVTRYAYDANDRLVFTLDPMGNLQGNSYDAEGRIVKSVSYATPIDPNELGATPSIAQIESIVENASTDNVEHRVFDKDGRLTATVNGLGEVVKFKYDASGNLIERVAYANRDWGWVEGTEPTPGTDPADQRTRFVYDQLDRLIYTLDGVGAVVRQIYDDNGNVLERIAYSATVSEFTVPTAADIAAAVTLIADPTRDAHDRFVYDSANRVTWHANGVGAVTQQVYDKNGNLTKRIDYATAISGATAPDAVPASSGDRITDMVYDRADRLSFSIDALGSVTQFHYDAIGNVVLRYNFANRIAAPTSTSARTAAQVGAAVTYFDPTGADRVERFVFDAAGREVLRMDASGAVTQTQYNGVGNALWTYEYAERVNPDLLWNNWQSGFSDFIPQLHGNASDRIVHHAFDAAGRLAYVLDEMGYVTKYSYDGVGRLTQTTAYAVATPPGAIPSVISVIEQAIVADLRDRTTSFSYDSEGRLISSTDAFGYSETYVYDGAGNKVEFKNKSGDSWRYEYDAAGQLVLERAPTGAGSLVDWGYGGGSSATVDTQLSYDALGNLISRTEAANTGIARTTSYDYDALGRQIRTVFPTVGIYDPSSDPIFADAGYGGYGGYGGGTRYERYEALQSQVFYDVFGDAVANVDVAGNVSVKAYDRAGRLTYDVDALGYVTSYQRNAFGEVTALTRHANATSLHQSFTPGVDSAPTANAVGSALALSGTDRTITTRYDRAGQAVEITQPSAWVYDGNGHSYQASAVTRHVYSAFGQVIQTQVLADAVNGVWATTTNYYDGRGQVVASVDAMGFATTHQYDANGNVVSTTEFANAGPAADPANLVLPSGSANDRTTLFGYDLENRKISQTQVNVRYSTASDGSFTVDNLTTHFGYDKLGNNIWVVDALGGTTYTYYDALGRVSAVAGPARGVPSTSRTVIPLKEFERDALGNVIRTYEYATGAVYADESGYGLSRSYYSSFDSDTGLYTVGYYDPNDVYNGRKGFYDWSAEYYGGRVTSTEYDSLGRAIYVEDANGGVQKMSYDEHGRLAKAWQVVYSPNAYASQQLLYTAFEYDALGRQTRIITPGSNSVLSETIYDRDEPYVDAVVIGVAWNAFGEMVARGTYEEDNQPNYQEWFEYDNAGRLWRTNTGDGNVKVSLYNLQGHQTAQISSAGTTNITSFASAQEVDAQGYTGLRRMDSQLDLLGRTVTQTLPLRQDSTDAAAYRPVVHQSYDRWGNIVSQTDSRNSGWVTLYSYNANNQIIRKTQPDSTGAQSANSPVTEIYYDALGRQVALRDANGNVNGQEWDAGGNLVRELHADTGVVTNTYDAFGDRTKLTDAMGYVTRYSYDGMGRNTSVTHYGVGIFEVNGLANVTGGVGNLTTRKEYDAAGRVVRQIDGTGAATTYVYDARGNVVRTIDADSFETRATFNAQGRQTASQDANFSIATWDYDAFGLLVGHTDIGGANYSFDYDAARQLLSQTNSRGQNRSYSYDGAGQLTGIVDNAIGQTTTYAYNAAGQRVREQMVQGGVVYQDQWIGYDTLGRQSLIEAINGVTVTTSFDKVGNKLQQHTTYTTQFGAAAQDLWYAYDVMNRQILVDGAVDGNADNLANITGTQGHVLAYDLNGNRKMDMSWGNRVVTRFATLDEAGEPLAVPVFAGSLVEQGITTQWYSYDAMNRLESVSTGGWAQMQTGTDEAGGAGNPVFGATEAFGSPQGILLDTRRYDGASRVVHSGPAMSLPMAYIQQLTLGNVNLPGAITTTTKYDAAGRAIYQVVINEANPWASYNVFYQQFQPGIPSPYDQPAPGASGYDAAGNLRTYRIWRGDGAGNFNSETYLVAHRKFEGYVQDYTFEVDINSQTNEAVGGVVTQSYDVNGFLTAVSDSATPVNNRVFINDAQGQALQRSSVPVWQTNQLIVDGEVVGLYGAERHALTPSYPNGMPYYVPVGDFNLAYQPVTATYPGAGTGQYTVQSGDTLKAIALAAYGDASLWYLVADANALKGDSDLRVGQMLNIPTRIASASNNASSYTPYDPSRIVGSTKPELPMPAGKDDGDCGVIGKIVMVVVAVVATVWTAGAAAGAFGAVGTGAAGTTVGVAAGTGIGATTFGTGMAALAGGYGSLGLAAAAVGGAVGSIASQAVGIAIGAQDEFSWSGVALGALSAGVSAGVGAATWGTALGAGGSGPSSWLATAGRSAISSAATQGLAVAIGLQDRFSWSQVAASAVGAGVGAAVTEGVGSMLNSGRGLSFGQTVAARAAGSFAAGVTTAALRGGRVSVTQVAVDAFGNALGDSLAHANGQGSSVPGPVGADERATIMGIFADGSGHGSAAFPDMSATTADQLRSDLGLGASGYGGGTQYASASGVRRTGVMTDAGGGGINPESMESLRQPDGTYRTEIRGVDDSPLSDADIASMRSENLSRAQTLAAQSATGGNGGSGNVQSWTDADGRYHVQFGPADTSAGNSFIDEVRSGTTSPVRQSTVVGVDLPPLGAGAGRGFVNPASAGLSTAERAGLIALGGKDAIVGAAETAGYSYGLAGTPQARAEWAIRTSAAGIAGMRKFFSDPKSAASGWWSDLNSNDPQAVREASAVGSGVVLGVGGGIVSGRLMSPNSAGVSVLRQTDAGGMGELPIHAQAAAKGYSGVRVNPNGGPTFAGTDYLYPVSEGQRNIVEITMQGSRRMDFELANRAAGLAETPANYVWHHVADFEPLTGKATLELVEIGAHKATYPHIGSVGQWEVVNNAKYLR
jgi:YD repeat-containing protein